MSVCPSTNEHLLAIVSEMIQWLYKFLYDHWSIIKDLLEIGIQAIAAVGTVAAVIVALRLAGQASKEELRIFANLMEEIGTKKEWVMITVTSYSQLPVTIALVGWCVGAGKRKNRTRAIINPSLPQIATLPVRLEYGAEHKFAFDPEELLNGTSKLLRDLKNVSRTKARKRIEVMIATTGKKGEHYLALAKGIKGHTHGNSMWATEVACQRIYNQAWLFPLDSRSEKYVVEFLNEQEATFTKALLPSTAPRRFIMMPRQKVALDITDVQPHALRFNAHH